MLTHSSSRRLRWQIVCNRKKNVLWNLSKFDTGLEETGRERRGEDRNREKRENGE